MQQKKSLLIVLVSIISVCVLGVISSLCFNWPVDRQNASGNVAKSTRFSRKTAQEGATLMQEHLLSDAQYKNSVVAAYLVMQTRAKQFNALVDMSDQVAGSIKAFESVLSDMKKAQPMVNNVCASMAAAAADLNSALGGQTPKNLAQSTNNAALAYNTLQKQNSLATRFIDTTDEYLKGNSAEDKLKFVRDQWVEYQQVTAALEQDAEAAAALEAKGRLLDAEQSISALRMFNQNNQEAVIFGTAVETQMGMEPTLSPVLSLQGAEEFLGMGGQEIVIKNEAGETVMQLSEGETVMKSADGETLVKNAEGETVMKMAGGEVFVQNGPFEAVMQLAGGESIVKMAGGEALIKNGEGETFMQLAGSESIVKMAGQEIVIKNEAGDTVMQLSEGETVMKSADGETLVKNAEGETVMKMAGGEVFVQNGAAGDTFMQLAGGESIVKMAGGETLVKLSGSESPLNNFVMANSPELTNLQLASGEVAMKLGADAESFLSNAGSVSTFISNLAGEQQPVIGLSAETNPQ